MKKLLAFITLFIAFLKAEKALIPFIVNLATPQNLKDTFPYEKTPFFTYLKDKNILTSRWILDGFRWDETTQGYVYWMILSDKWSEEVYTYKNKLKLDELAEADKEREDRRVSYPEKALADV